MFDIFKKDVTIKCYNLEELAKLLELNEKFLILYLSKDL